MTDFGNCQTITNNKLIPLEENKRKITFINNSKSVIRKIRVDGCVIKEGLKCDYLLIDKKDKEFFIEFKGGDIEHAIEQIKATIIQLSVNQKAQEKCSFVISASCPLTTTKIQIFKIFFKTHFNSELIIKNRYCEYNIDY